MKIKVATDSDQKKWDDFAREQVGSSPYLLFAWGRAIEAAYGHKTFYLIAEKNKEVVGILPLVYMKPFWGVGQMLSLPYCDLGDLFSQDLETGKALLAKAFSLAKDLNIEFLELRSRMPTLILPEEPVVSIRTLSHKVSMILDLPASSELVWKNFKSKLRSQVRKAEKNGCRFSWGGLDHLDVFYDVFSINMRDLGSPVHSKAWFQCVLKYYGSDARMALVFYEKKVIGAGVILFKGKQVSIPWASTLRSHNHLSPNMLLYWKILEYACDHDYSAFDFGRSTPGEGTYKFKAQWGALPIPLYWHYISLNGKTVEVGGSKKGKLDLAMQCWKKLPVPVTQLVGPMIRKHIGL